MILVRGGVMILRNHTLFGPVPAIHDIAGLSRRIEVRHHPRNRPGRADPLVRPAARPLLGAGPNLTKVNSRVYS